MIKNIFSKTILKIFIVFFLILFLLLLVVLGYNTIFAHKIFPGVKINGHSFAGQSYSETYNYLQKQSSKLMNQGINYQYLDRVVNIRLVVDTLDDPDLRKKIINFQNEETVHSAFAIGHYHGLKNNLREQIQLLFHPQNINWRYSLDEAELKNILRENFSEYESNFSPLTISLIKGKVVIASPAPSRQFNYDAVIQKTKDNITSFKMLPIIMNLKEIPAPITIAQSQQKKSLIRKISNLKSIVLNYDSYFWKINSAIFNNWLVLKSNQKGQVLVSFDLQKYENYLKKFIIPDVNRQSQNAKFEIKNGRVVKFQGSQDGRQVNVQDTLEEITFALNNLEHTASTSSELAVDLIVDSSPAEVETKNINDLGIKEIIGSGESNFRGSPPNRVHNIQTGADKLNGILIAPGEEFATMENLVPIDAQHGYLPELVIKGNKTIPEYGGGLCQIGTTIYRAALHSGLKIIQRRPHSYRVYYYEPAGMDATIYDPWPDMKFVNDTNNYILIQTRIVGTKLYFDFWGTKDGRQVTVSDPVIYNIVRPGPTKEIETLDLKPGQRKCTESAHNGADAYFDYKVDYADDRETYEERVRSHYVPWQAVCLVGVAEISTSTVKTINEE